MVTLGQREIENLRHGTWELHSLSMKLARKDGTRTFSGPGYIRQDEKRQLAFTLYDSGYNRATKDLFEDLGEKTRKLGEFYPQDQDYVLTAANEWCAEWCSSPTADVHIDYGTGCGTIVSGKVQELSIDEKIRRSIYEKLFLHYYFVHDFRYPANKPMETISSVAGKKISQSSSFDAAEFEAQGFFLRIHNDRGIIHVVAQSQTPSDSCPQGLDCRFHETLQFVIGRPVHWTLLQIGCGNRLLTRIRSGRKLPETGVGLPALMFGPAPEESVPVFTMFDRYLKFVLRHGSGNDWHPVSRRVFTLQHASAYLWNIRMLVTGVEVEGLLKDEYGEKDISAAKRLDGMARKGIVRATDVANWKRVRHNAAHGVRSECEVTQENMDRIHSVVVLFYHLVFNLIGYRGAYTDYGTRGFPRREYPPSASEARPSPATKNIPEESC